MNGIIHLANFLKSPDILYNYLINNIIWDERMAARKTASFGKAYNYSQIGYPFQAFLPELQSIVAQLNPIISFEANNCLINYYLDGRSKMGFHSDNIDILAPNTGIAIVSLGEKRDITFRNIEHPEEIITYSLESGSLLYMTQEIQNLWQHAIPKSNTENSRLSLTFRQLI